MNELFRTLLLLPPQASNFAGEIDALHYAIISASLFGWLVVLVVTAWFLVRWRRGAPPAEPRARYRLPLWMEGVMIAGLLAGFLGVWVLGHAQYVRMQTPPEKSLDVYVVAKQWMWSFAYADGTASNHDLYVPTGRPVRLLLTSRDVIHSFFVPAFRIKQDVVPGRMTSTWFRVERAGTYPLFCTEYCGLSHSYMLGRVIALDPEHYEDWKRDDFDPAEPARGTRPSARLSVAGRPDNLASVGERVASERGCLRCHTLDGTPHLGPSWAGLYGSPITMQDGRQVLADDAYLTRSMMEPMSDVRAGFQPIMPSYLGVLSAAETGALVALIHTLQDRPQADPAAPLPYPSAETPVTVPAQAAPGVQPANPPTLEMESRPEPAETP